MVNLNSNSNQQNSNDPFYFNGRSLLVLICTGIMIPDFLYRPRAHDRPDPMIPSLLTSFPQFINKFIGPGPMIPGKL